jgi:hypothetical protein
MSEETEKTLREPDPDVDQPAQDVIGAAIGVSYLRMTGCYLGLLINFNVSVLKNGIKMAVLS